MGRVLVIAGSDCSGGAGIQADIKTITMLGGYAATAITALTAQNTLGVHNVYHVPPAFIKEQIKVIIDDIGADVIKIGMLADAEIIKAVREAIEKMVASGVKLVLDPVMVAKGGALLLAKEAIQTLAEQLLPLATIITPNIYEAQTLTGLPVETEDQRLQGARRLQAIGAKNVLITGGDQKSDNLFDVLLDEKGLEKIWSHPRQVTKHTHGTGCSLASALATGLADGLSLADSIEQARDFVQRAIAAAPNLGSGHGPLGHANIKNIKNINRD